MGAQSKHEMQVCHKLSANMLVDTMNAKSGGGSGLHFPMYVIRMTDLLEMTEVAPHNELLAQGKLHKYEPGMGCVTFVSHQWCGKAHPDPHFQQFKVFQNALYHLFAGSISIEWDFKNKAFAKAVETMTAVEIQELQSGYVWFDYFSVPQLKARSASASIQMQVDTQAAVDSIPSYVQFSKYFLILAPTVPKVECPDEGLDYLTWCSRGWCRLERAARVLSPQQDTRMILVAGSDCMKFVGADAYLQDPPGKGDFAYDSDREAVVKVMSAMVSHKLQFHKARGELHKYRMLLSLQGSLLSGKSPDSCKFSHCEDLSAFLKQYQFDSSTDKDECGWTPMHYAAIAGAVPVMQSLLDHGADIHSATLKVDADFFCVPEHTSIAHAVRWGGAKAVEFLLDSGAKLNDACMAYGVQPIAHAAFSGNHSSLETLMARKANLNVRTAMNTTPLEAAIMNSHDATAIKLLQAGAPLDASSEGIGPLHYISLFSYSEKLVQHFIHAKCDPNGKIRIDPSQCFSHIFAEGAENYLRGDRDELALLGHHASGLTPLMTAVILGKDNIVKALVRSGADPDLCNDHGVTAMKLVTHAPSFMSPARQKRIMKLLASPTITISSADTL